MSSINEEQKRAIESPVNRPVIVKASAGTGKTRVLTERILFLIEKQGIKAENILAITFTKLAAEEMKQRVHKELKDSYKIPTSIGTIHSLFAEILRRDISRICEEKNEENNRDFSFDILYEDEQIRKIKQAARKTSASLSKQNISDIKNYISLWKTDRFLNEGKLDPVIVDQYEELFEEYDKNLKKENKLDFDDVLILSSILLKRNSDLVEYWKNRYKCILVDECQDLNEVQWQLIKYLLNPDGYGFFAVGDPNQCIYMFNGAKEDIFESMFKFFDKAKVEEVDLVVNYRSDKSIVDFSNKLKVIPTKNSFSHSNLSGLLKEFDTLEEALFEIKKHNDYKSWAILFRKHAQAKSAISELIKQAIPFRISEFYLFDEKKIERIIDFLKIVFFDNSGPLETLIRNGCLGFSEYSIKNICNWEIIPPETTLLEIILGDVQKAINLFNLSERESQILKYLSQELHELRNIPEENLEQIIRKIKLYLFPKNTKSEESKIELFITWISNISKSTRLSSHEIILDLKRFAEFEKEDIANHKNEYITLSTIHRTKGLEWENVVILDWEELLKSDEKNDKHLPYVAATRAQKQLFLIKGNPK